MTQSAYDVSSIPTLLALLERDALETEGYLPAGLKLPPRLLGRALFEPLREAAGRPGREFRARLLGLAARLAGSSEPAPPELLGCVEALHLGSLIVDDIEDGSARRRGGQALHRLYGVPLALNAGNWLYFYPGAALLPRLGLEPGLELALRQTIDRAVLRCHVGQSLDLSVRVTELRQREVHGVVYGMTRLKTGSLMELAAELGALSANATSHEVTALASLGRDIGVALQMLDDLTGMTCERRAHKGHEDLLEARATWVWAWLAAQEDEVSYLRLRSLLEAVAAHDLHPEQLAQQLRERVGESGRAKIRAHLAGVLRDARRAFAGSRALLELSEELARLERYDG